MIQNGQTIAGGYGQCYQLNQLYYPKGIYIDDWKNNRIVEWK